MAALCGIETECEKRMCETTSVKRVSPVMRADACPTPDASHVAGQHLRDVQHAGRRVSGTPQTAFDVEHAAKIAQHHRPRAARTDICAFLVDDRRRNVAVLDRERAAESAAMLA